MSGWTYTTVEPADSVLDNEKALLDVQKNVEEATTEITKNHPRELDEDDIRRLKQRLDELKRAISYDSADLVDEYLESKAEDGLVEFPSHTALYGERGIANSHRASDFVERIAKGIGYKHVNRVLLISTNDTSDSGVGTLYDVKDDRVVHVETWKGYENAMGYDVRGHFADHYNIRGRGGR